MKKELSITVVTGVIVALVLAVASSVTAIYKLEAEIVTLEEKLANTESANEVLVEQLKQIIGGR